MEEPKEFITVLPKRDYSTVIPRRIFERPLPERRFIAGGVRKFGIPTPLPAVGLRYVYTLRSGGMDIYDLLNRTNPALAATVSDGTHNGGGNLANGQVPDTDYVWINDGTNLFTYLVTGHELNPTLVSTLNNKQGLVVRRALASRNNLLFAYNANTANIESWNITDPTNPTLVNAKTRPLTFFDQTLAYDAAGNRLVCMFHDNFANTFLYGYAVAADGTLSDAANIGANLDSGAGYAAQNGFIYGTNYWTYLRFGNMFPWKLSGAGADTGGGSLPGSYAFGGIRARLRGKYLFLGASQTDASWQAVRIIDISTWTVIAQLGGAGNACGSLLTSGNLLVFAVGLILYTYDITALLSSGGAPVLLGNVTGPASINGLAGYPTDGWEGNNGGCAT